MNSTRDRQPALSLQTPSSKPVLDWSGVKRVLFVRLRSIGDTVLMTPCLSALKRLNPRVEVAVVSEPLSAPILEDNELVDSLIVTDSSIPARVRLCRRLRRFRFDAAFNLHGGTTATLLVAASGARYTIGYRGHRQSWLLNVRAPAPDAILGRETVHSVEQQLALLSWAGIPYPERPRLRLSVSAAIEAEMRSRVKSTPLSQFAVIAPGAAFESKRWPAGRFAAVADHLSRRHALQSVVIAGPGQERTAAEVSAQASSRPQLITGISLRELVALMSLSRLYVGNDSGPMHIAAALNRPLVAVFGSSKPSVWRPWTDAPYDVVEPDREVGGSIGSIPLDLVLAAADRVMASALAATN